MNKKKITISIPLVIIILCIGIGGYQFKLNMDKLHDFYTSRDGFVGAYEEFKEDLAKLDQGENVSFSDFYYAFSLVQDEGKNVFGAIERGSMVFLWSVGLEQEDADAEYLLDIRRHLNQLFYIGVDIIYDRQPEMEFIKAMEDCDKLLSRVVEVE